METKTTYKIDKIQYIVESRSSENATDSLHKKIEKLLIRDVRHNAEQLGLCSEGAGQNGENSEI